MVASCPLLFQGGETKKGLLSEGSFHDASGDCIEFISSENSGHDVPPSLADLCIKLALLGDEKSRHTQTSGSETQPSDLQVQQVNIAL